MQEDKPPDEEDSGDEEEQCPGGSVFETRSRGMTGTSNGSLSGCRLR
jgi:hypothetical protein